MISRLTGDPVLRTIAVVTALYFAQSLLLPVVLAFLLSLALTPVVDRLHAWGVKRSLAVLLSVLLTLGAAGGLGWLVTGQLVGLAKSLPAHRERILARTESLGPLGRAMREAYARFQATVQSGVPATGEDQGKETPPREKPPEAAAPRGGEPMGSSEIAQTLKSVVTALAGTLGNFFIVMVLVLLFLGSQEDLRDRGLKLFQERGLKVNRAQFSEIGDKISKYLISEVVVNAAYGGLVGVAMVVLGVEQPLFWGLLAFLFRFIPYIGIWLVATLTFLLSLATTDAWGKPLG
ncbi:MAG TPA: AI-2E family transporter, partial [Planctomycetota bacterium]|nr:AI-2E family transporter [Planctomycetota bacterium]